MTLSSSVNRVQYAGDGITVSFTITFKFWDQDDISVIHADSSGTETTWTRGTQFTVTGGSGATGTLTVKTTPTDYTPATGETLTIKSDEPLTQTTSLPSGGAFPSASVEERFDKTTRLIQQLQESVDRAVKLAETSASSNIVLPEPAAGKILQWNSAGTALENGTAVTSTLTTPVTIANGGTAGATAVAARSNLGIKVTAQRVQLFQNHI